VKEFVRFESCLFVGEVEVAVGNGAGATGRDEGELGIVGEEGRRRVGSWAGVDDVAAEGAAVLVGDAAGPACRLRKDREFV